MRSSVLWKCFSSVYFLQFSIKQKQDCSVRVKVEELARKEERYVGSWETAWCSMASEVVQAR